VTAVHADGGLQERSSGPCVRQFYAGGKISACCLAKSVLHATASAGSTDRRGGNGFGVGRAIKRSRIRLPVWVRLSNDSGQVVHSLVLLSPSSIIIITSGQSNLTLGRITAAHERLNHIRHVAPMCTPM